MFAVSLNKDKSNKYRIEMSIKPTYDINGFLTQLQYKNWKIPVKSYHAVIMRNDSDNYGKRLEQNRIGDRTSEEVNELEDGFLASVVAINSIETDYVQVFYPNHEFRKEKLEHFVNALQINSDLVYSLRFQKNENRSITEFEENDLQGQFDLFSFDSSEIKPIKKLILIDDTINEGRTIRAFLAHLEANNLIDDNTEITAYCVYNLAGSSKKGRDIMAWYRNQQQ